MSIIKNDRTIGVAYEHHSMAAMGSTRLCYAAWDYGRKKIFRRCVASILALYL